MTKVEQIKAWAMDNYAESYGASSLIECWTDEELDAEFKSLEDAKSAAKLWDEQYHSVRSEIF